MAQWTFFITFLFIIASVLVGVFISGRSKDKCLKDFHGQPVVVCLRGEKDLECNLIVESSGMELILNGEDAKEGGRKGYILYKDEYPKINKILRKYASLNPSQKKSRDSYLKTDYYNSMKRSTLRRLKNLFSTFRDSFMDAVNLFMGQMKKGVAVPAPLSGQDKYIGKIREELVGHFGRAYDPLLEKHIGRRVIAIEKVGEETKEHNGILKEYTPNFIEMLDIELEDFGKTDAIFPRATTVVRYVTG